MARVRRDEAKAAAEEMEKQQRIRIAENEDRIRRMRAETSNDDVATFGGQLAIGEDGHVNLFAVNETTRNHEMKNKEAEAEKKKEMDDREHKLGKILSESTVN
uniref:Leukocyte receptor cluster member 1 n=1 Tax=Panagrolaimus sp. JU765 TaxID=591449 RepID=A0AC34QZI1_9BILA